MDSFHLTTLIANLDEQQLAYLEFLRKGSMSVGLYHLPAQATDPQTPHHEDELYLVLSGKGQILVGDENQEVTSGSLVFVGKGVVHRFHHISQDLTILVFFAPAES